MRSTVSLLTPVSLAMTEATPGRFCGGDLRPSDRRVTQSAWATPVRPSNSAYRCICRSRSSLVRSERRKRIYEALHPEAASYAFKGNQHSKVVTDNLSFTSKTAEATGRDERTVRRDAARGEALGEDLEAIAGRSFFARVGSSLQQAYRLSLPSCRSSFNARS